MEKLNLLLNQLNELDPQAGAAIEAAPTTLTLLSSVHGVLLEAIVQKGVCCSFQNLPNGWKCELSSKVSSLVTKTAYGLDASASIAILEAYTNWLQFEC